MTTPARIVLGVCGGIAAYKIVGLVRELRRAGHQVQVVTTEAALEFVGRATWEAISGRAVGTGLFEATERVEHVALAADCDLVVIAPATADFLSRAAAGRANDLLAATVLTTTAPVLYVPAMHTQMWLNPATEANVSTLRARGAHVMQPDAGPLTSGDTGLGRLPEISAIVAAIDELLASRSSTEREPCGADMAGMRVLVTAGGTREPLDPVRFLGNRSSGRQGVALAADAARRGAEVTLIAANLSVDPPDGVDVINVSTARQMRAEAAKIAPDMDAIVMAAAVADYRPAESASDKIKRQADDLSLRLVPNPDILAELLAARDQRRALGQIVVGFAAETGTRQRSALDLGREKARRKGADLLAVNQVGEELGFDQPTNEVFLLDSAGELRAHRAGSKEQVAAMIWDEVRIEVDQRQAEADEPVI